ncbi:MAG: hypothetical protein EA001_04230 [Oscillatoriales cyanobacterium]|nr:MAG: hypothetical protein EA001_04230 [Oscillatoriales cyanobacterium]
MDDVAPPHSSIHCAARSDCVVSRDWTCPGTNPENPHPPELVTGTDCPLCGMSREAALKGPIPPPPPKSPGSGPVTQIDPYNQPSKRSKGNRWPWLIVPVLVAAGAMTPLILGRTGDPPKTCPTGQALVNGQCQTGVSPPPFPPELISGLSVPSANPTPGTAPIGPLKRLFREEKPDADRGVQLFNQTKFAEALEAFTKAANGDPKDAEILIYKNNALARTATKPPFRIAVIVPAIQNDEVAMEMLRGVAQAQERFNKQGGLNGRYLDLILATDKNDPALGEQVAQFLSTIPDVLAVVGHNISSVTEKVLPIYEKAGMPVISPTSTSTDLKSNTFFRTVPSDEATGNRLVAYLVSQKVTRVALVYDADRYSQSLLRVVKPELDAAQVTVVRGIELTIANFDPNAEIATLNNQPEIDRPEVIVLISGQKNQSVANQLMKANAQLPTDRRFRFVGSDALYDSETLTIGTDVVKGLILAVPWARDSASAEQFTERVRALWKGDVGWRTATSYDALQALIQSLSDQANRASILAALQQVNLPPTETSGDSLAFTNGDRAGEAVLVEATNRPSCGQVAGTGMAFCLLREGRSPKSSPSPTP